MSGRRRPTDSHLEPVNNTPAHHTKPIRIGQLNTNRRKLVVQTLPNQYVKDFDILLVPEPSWGQIGGGKMGPVGAAGWTPILPESVENRPRVMTYVTTGRVDFTATLRSDIIVSGDIQVLDICQAGHPTTTVVNVYNDSQLRHATVSRHLSTLGLPQNAIIISGD
ncbi:hypothetical protein BDV98DRAFT_598822 [Pterulicium gracile]|uniref:Uncharacterized protein n=1 Tax=Pterulicium gracile TaxID=1884261 RepID=A0A5C3Q0W3_9AGAR|nr:hypothetical protein BDV98DRAFT_598822 [Pterula gracilis]